MRGKLRVATESVLTVWKFSNLSADDFCILRAECIFTDGAPGIVDADLHSTLQWVAPPHQSQITSGAVRLMSG